MPNSKTCYSYQLAEWELQAAHFLKLTKLDYSILTCGRLLMAAWCMRLRPDSSCFISWDICDLRDSSEKTATKPLWAATFNPAGMFYKTQTWWTMRWVITPFVASGHTGWYVGHKHIFVLHLWWSSTSKQIKFSSLQEPIASLKKVKDDFSTKTQTKTSHIKIKFQCKKLVCLWYYLLRFEFHLQWNNIFSWAFLDISTTTLNLPSL